MLNFFPREADKFINVAEARMRQHVQQQQVFLYFHTVACQMVLICLDLSWSSRGLVVYSYAFRFVACLVQAAAQREMEAAHAAERALHPADYDEFDGETHDIYAEGVPPFSSQSSAFSPPLLPSPLLLLPPLPPSSSSPFPPSFSSLLPPSSLPSPLRS